MPMPTSKRKPAHSTVAVAEPAQALLSFGTAITAVFAGKRVRRLGWPEETTNVYVCVDAGALSIRTIDGITRHLIVTAGDVENDDWVVVDA